MSVAVPVLGVVMRLPDPRLQAGGMPVSPLQGEVRQQAQQQVGVTL
jgi:hypothetical protein